MIDKYNKLVRDKIPEIIRLHGDNPIARVLPDDEYFAALNLKLGEEVSEYLADFNVDELADIVEVVYAIVRHKGLSIGEFECMRIKKQTERGGFNDRISLIEVERKT